MYDQNVDKLPGEALDLLAFAKSPITTGWEVRLDYPIRNIIEGGDGYISHMLTWTPCYLLHAGDEGWAIIDADNVGGDEDKGRTVALAYLEKSRDDKPATGLARYAVKRDKFEADDAQRALEFPCCICVHCFEADNQEPCRTCDHNVNAVREEPSK